MDGVRARCEPLHELHEIAALDDVDEDHPSAVDVEASEGDRMFGDLEPVAPSADPPGLRHRLAAVVEPVAPAALADHDAYGVVVRVYVRRLDQTLSALAPLPRVSELLRDGKGAGRLHPAEDSSPLQRAAAPTPARERARSSAAPTNSRKSGAGLVGRDLNSGWNWLATNHG